MLVTLNAVLSHLRGSGRAAIAGQPSLGLAGKPWGALVPGAWMPPVLLLLIVAFAIGWRAGIGGPLVVPALPICLILFGYYVRILWSIERARRVLRRRGVGSPFQEIQMKNFEKTEFQSAVAVIASAARISPEKLRWTDRFGFEIGTFSSFDETLDRLGGRLLIEQNRARRPLVLENIRTIGDYVCEWVACTRAQEHR